ncbi:mroh1 [Symbiodinium sp. KB8]|nr:mroh1 [Symbiodinium sp. KB8]
MDFPSRNGSLGTRSDGKRMIVTKAPPARTDGQGDVNPMVDDADLVKEVVYSLLSAKGGATSTQQVQVAINSSLIQIAKTNFPLVVAAVFSALETQKVSDQHKLQLLRLLCQVLETRRSDTEGKPCEVDRTLAKNLTRHLVAEVLVGAGDARQRAVADVLVELAPMHPDLVIGDLLAGIASSSSEKSEKEKLPVQLVQILSEVASTFPLSLRSRLDEVLTKYFALLQSCRGGDLPVLLLRAWCSLSVAMVCCATDLSEPPDVSDPTFTRDFAEAAQILGAVFALVMSAWPSWKDLNLRVAAVETLGHISLVIPKDQFLTNADSLLEHIASLLSRQGAFTTAASPLPPLRLLRGASLALQACIDADPEILTLESTLQTMLSSLFAWASLRGPLQEPGLSQEALQSQAELLKCFEILAECFASETFGFLLQKERPRL